MVARPRIQRPSPIALSALILALAAILSLASSCRQRSDRGARADGGPAATAGKLLIIVTGDTRASLETCS